MKSSLRSFGIVVLFGLTACATPLDRPLKGYLCCNVMIDHNWVSSNNELGGSYFPLGTPAEIHAIKRSYYAYGPVKGDDYGWRADHAKSQEQTEAWLRRLIIPADPKNELSKFPNDVRNAIMSAKVFVGMTREQVMMALGPPSERLTAKLTDPIWSYWIKSEEDLVELKFEQDKLIDIKAGTIGLASLRYHR